MILAHKKIGETPLELIKRIAPNKSPITYAGRLDPMAEGLMILLKGKEVHDKDKYLKLNKTYHLDILLGISTDTYDTLGIITKINLSKKIPPLLIKKTIQNYPRKYSQPYPPYSSKPVDGHPLWWWAKNNKLEKIKIPSKNIKITNLELNSAFDQKLSKIVKTIISNIKKVKGDFRQKEIISDWKDLVSNNPNKKLQILNLTISCSAGTYMRSIANKIGEKLKIPALALKINRTAIGNYS